MCLSLLTICSNKVNAIESVDMFETIKIYAEENVKKETVSSVEVVSDGESLEDILNNKVVEKYEIALKNKEDKNENNTESNVDNDGVTNDNVLNGENKPNKYPNQDSFFAGTTDFTNITTSRKDAILNGWSAVRKSYDKYDDGGDDNVTIIATAYTSAAEENGGWEGMNAIGGKLGPGCIAAPKDIAFQTKIRISGLGVFNVEDRGSAIVRVSDDIIRVDVWMDSYKEAMHFGKRVYRGRIL